MLAIDLGAILVATALSPDGGVQREAASACPDIPLFEGGRIVGRVCAQAGPTGDGPTRVDLGDEWAPRAFSETPDHPQSYRRTLVALANERIGTGTAWDSARRDRYFELYGIFPSVSVIRRRLLDDARHACHDAVDDTPLAALTTTVAPWTVPSGARAAAVAGALRSAQTHLRCDGLLGPRAAEGRFDAATQEALSLFQRRHMLPSAGLLDGETKEALLAGSRELDFRTLLRALRERVVDATGLIEDGSALNAWEPVLGRFIESTEYRRVLRAPPLPRGAPDLVARATEAAAVALGWTSPEAAAHALASIPTSGGVALRLPPLPTYHAGDMELRAEIDRGDVWTSYPFDSDGRRLPPPVKNRPTLTLYARTDSGEIPLVRWATTIGAWKPEKLGDGSESLRYKESPVGRFYWHDLIAAPAWFPPPTTPDRELVHRGAAGAWAADVDAVGPGYRSAYGLVALFHHRLVVASGGVQQPADIDVGIRTHGSANYRSILRGSSHGCHRLFNHLALRLGSFVLAHAGHVRQGHRDERYARTLHWKGHAFRLRAESRGYDYELVPPIPVDVLPGRRVRSKVTPAAPSRPAPAATPSGVPPPATPQT